MGIGKGHLLTNLLENTTDKNLLFPFLTIKKVGTQFKPKTILNVGTLIFQPWKLQLYTILLLLIYVQEGRQGAG